MAMKSYCLKMTDDMWDVVDRHRLALVGNLIPQGITRADYIREAITQYSRQFEKRHMPRIQSAKNDLDEPLGIFFPDNEMDLPGWGKANDW